MSAYSPLEVLVAKQEIHEVLLRYCRGVDRLDEELIAEAYHHGAHDDHGVFRGDGKKFAQFLVEAKRRETDLSVHMVGNHLIEVHGEDATSEAYFLASQVRTVEDGSKVLDIVSGRYLDSWEKRRGHWRISGRQVVHDWQTSMPLRRSTAPYAETPIPRGRRGPDDLVYSLLSRIEGDG